MKFIVIAQPRTGSSHFVSRLGAHPDIFCNGNALNRNVWVFWPDLSKEEKQDLIKLRRESREALLELVFAKNFGRAPVGFKIFQRESDALLDEMIKDSSIRKIILYRSNVLANYSSSLIAAKSGIYGVTPGQKAPNLKLRFNTKRFLRFHNAYVGYYSSVINKLREAGEPFHTILYDQINDDLFFSGVLNFIGADATVALSTEAQRKRHLKMNPADILSRFAEPDIVRKYLAARGLLHWAYEGQNTLSLLDTGPRDQPSETRSGNEEPAQADDIARPSDYDEAPGPE